MSVYREAQPDCGLCAAELDEGATPRAGELPLCADCRAGRLGRAEARWGFECETDIKLINPSRNSFYRLVVEVRRPTHVDLVAHLRPEGTGDRIKHFFGSHDPEIADSELDDLAHVEVDDAFIDRLYRLAARPAARRAMINLLSAGCEIELSFRTVFARADARRQPTDLPDGLTVLVDLFVLASEVERLA